MKGNVNGEIKTFRFDSYTGEMKLKWEFQVKMVRNWSSVAS